MWILVGATILSIVAKIWVARCLWRARNSSVALLALVVVLLAYSQSVLEIYGYYRALNPGGDLTILLRVYHATVVSYLVLLCVLSHAVINEKPSRYAVGAAALFALSVSTWFVFSDAFVAGATKLSYTYTRIPGDYYWLFQITVISTLIAGIVLPSIMYRRAKSELQRIRSANIIIGLSSLLVFFVLLFVAMIAGLKINATGILPLVLAFYLFVVAECMSDDAIVDMRFYLPWTEQARILRELKRDLILIKPNAQTDLRALKQRLHDFKVKTSVGIYETRKKAAQSLALSETKLSRDYARIVKNK